MTNNHVSLILQAIEENDIKKLTDQLKSQIDSQNDKILSTHNYIKCLHAALKLENSSSKIISKIIEDARNYKHSKKQNQTKKDSIYKIINSRSDDGTERTPLHIALEKSNPKKKIITLLINNGTDISDRYTGPSDIIKKRTYADNYLHIAAKTRNIDAFLLLFKKSIERNIHLLSEYNENHENPLHTAARSSMLSVVVRGMFNYLQSTANNEIKKLENSTKKEDKMNIKEHQKKLREIKAKLENSKNHIRNALYSKDASGNTPLSERYISKEEKETIKKAVDIKDKLVYNRRLYLHLYAMGTIACIAALCTCVLLFPASQAFVLSSIISIIIGGISYLPLKAYNEIQNLYDEGFPIQDAEITQFSETDLTITS